MTGKISILSVLTMIILSASYNLTYAQESESQEAAFHKNAIYGNVGTGGLYFTTAGYYERIIKQKMWDKNISSFVKVGTGVEFHWGGSGMFILAQYGLLTGAKKHHLEISVGPNYFITGDYKGDVLPISGAIGWRVQKPEGKFIFRMGASWPEAIYIGLGVSF